MSIGQNPKWSTCAVLLFMFQGEKLSFALHMYQCQVRKVTMCLEIAFHSSCACWRLDGVLFSVWVSFCKFKGDEVTIGRVMDAHIGKSDRHCMALVQHSPLPACSVLTPS